MFTNEFTALRSIFAQAYIHTKYVQKPRSPEANIKQLSKTIIYETQMTNYVTYAIHLTNLGLVQMDT